MDKEMGTGLNNDDKDDLAANYTPAGSYAELGEDKPEVLTGVDKGIIPLLKKINTVVKKIKWVSKDGQNTTQNYSYATEAGVLAQVKELFGEVGIVLTHQQYEPIVIRDIKTRSGGVMPVTRIRIDFKMSDCDTGAFIITPCYGDGMDSGDKGLYKAITGATKYFLLKTTMMPTGDDPEKDGISEDAPKKKVDVKKPADIGKMKNGLSKDIQKLPEELRPVYQAKVDKAKTTKEVEAIVSDVASALF